MAEQTRNAGLGQSLVYGTKPWSSPTNIYASDDAKAACNLPLYTLSYWLQATNFGFSIPAGSTINGIKVFIEKQCNRTNAVKDAAVYIVKGGTRQGTDKKNANFWPTSDAYISYGSSTDLWGLSWTPSDINASNFGVALAAENQWYDSSTTYARVDHIYITVYYTEPIQPGWIKVGGAWEKVYFSGSKIAVSGSWRSIQKVYIKSGGVWEQVWAA